jgi:hypothetical protein
MFVERLNRNFEFTADFFDGEIFDSSANGEFADFVEDGFEVAVHKLILGGFISKNHAKVLKFNSFKNLVNLQTFWIAFDFMTRYPLSSFFYTFSPYCDPT